MRHQLPLLLEEYSHIAVRKCFKDYENLRSAIERFKTIRSGITKILSITFHTIKSYFKTSIYLTVICLKENAFNNLLPLCPIWTNLYKLTFYDPEKNLNY